MGEKIGGIDFAFLGAADFVDGQLQFVAVIFDARLHFHIVIAFKRRCHLVEAVPHAGLDAPRGIAQLQAQVGLAFASGANFLYTDKKVGGNGLAVLESSDEVLLHVPGFLLRGRIPNFLPPFLESSLSGVAATSSIGSAFTAAVST